ncbi:Transcriptional regulator, IclR family [Rubellimicrobium mesophilum DSM 19309]|uniref:Transcriptional regulator, IclR family n=1 Tax=Rubellimicrobium mesophilum DSM 19309 TaxID=442562 RepID=A0A017HIC3_9RHOB|nr:HTH-type transcriptional regulator BhcR [Rubellimicrobium mesophilum]EYD74267.1 Transcriptional regulator, IclR family [Rubellimicrobium mesophilum DSM 19309]
MVAAKDLTGNLKNGAERRPRGRPRAFDDKTDQNVIKSLDRSLEVLGELARLEATTLSELARALDEAPATVYRILVTMQAHRMVEFDEAQQVWHVGAGAFLIGSAFLRRTGLIERARPVLRSLMEATGETANLGVESDGAVLFVSQVETHAAIRAFFPPGTKSPLHASGIGKVLLAHAAPDQVRRLLARPLQGYTDRTLTDSGELSAALAEVRARGYAVDNEERTEGMRCVAAGIRNAYGETVAGLSVSGPVSRVRPDAIPALAARVVEAAEAVSLALGARPVSPPAG